ncbi:MAG: HAD family hydrolase [Candidatus Hodarchaeales archaeon]|jgi:HAD superfamily hydrolase (TIGR01549 family)
MSDIKIVSLDLFETLVHFESQKFDSRSTLDKALKSVDKVPDIKFETVYKQYSKIVREKMHDYFSEEEFRNDELLLNIWNSHNTPITPELEKLAFNVMTSYFSEVSHLVQPFPGVYETLQYLLDQGLQLVLVSNHTWSQNGWDLVELFNFKNYFKKIIFSADLGYKKPSSKIYDVMRDSFSEYNKNEIVHVGDDIQADIYGALKYGIKAIWIKNTKYLDLETIISDHPNYLGSINSIQELSNILTKK